MENKRMIATSLEDFGDKISAAIVTAMNTEKGQEYTRKILQNALAENPNLTEEDWRGIKQKFMMFMFYQFVGNCPEAMNELGEHVWNKLQEETEDEHTEF